MADTLQPYRMFYARWMNWNMLPPEDLLVRKEYLVYSDASVRIRAYYTQSRWSSWKTVSMQEPSFDAFQSALERFPDSECHNDAPQGDGWELCSWDSRGRELHRTSGYISGRPDLETIVALLPPTGSLFSEHGMLQRR